MADQLIAILATSAHDTWCVVLSLQAGALASQEQVMATQIGGLAFVHRRMLRRDRNADVEIVVAAAHPPCAWHAKLIGRHGVAAFMQRGASAADAASRSGRVHPPPHRGTSTGVSEDPPRNDHVAVDGPELFAALRVR